MSQEVDIAIVGAGAAGIGAARHLAKSGISALVLEALPRLGGRAWTREVAGASLDMGCGWLHSGERNPWRQLAEDMGFEVDRRDPAWHQQHRNLGFSKAERAAARGEFEAWSLRIAEAPPANDCAAELLPSGGPWNAYLQAMSGFISGDELERISARDYAAYDTASSDNNWRLPAGYGTVVAASFPSTVPLHLATPIQAIALDRKRVALETPAGTVKAKAVILTISTNQLAGDRIAMPRALDPWREAARRLPLGNDEKLFLEILDGHAFAPESHVLGDPRDARTGAYYIRPFGRPVIECFLGGAGARRATAEGAPAAFARAIDQLASLFGGSVRASLRPLIASDWAGTASIGGGYSHALPGQASARAALARPFDNRLFFAGEATHSTDFSTAHGAYQSGARAADEALAVLAPRAISG